MASTSGETETLRLRIREAEKRYREKTDNLSKSETRLAKIRGNRKKPPRGGGKTLEDEVQDFVTKLQAELQEDMLALEAMKSELQGSQDGPTPGENVESPTDEVHKQEVNSNQKDDGDGKESVPIAYPKQAGTASSVGSNVEANSLAVTANEPSQTTTPPTMPANSAPAASHETAEARTSTSLTNVGANSPAITAKEHLETTPQPNGLAKSAPTTNHDTAGLGPSQEAVDAAGLTNLTSIEADHPATVAKEQPQLTPQPSILANSVTTSHETVDSITPGGRQKISNPVDHAGPILQVMSDTENPLLTREGEVDDLRGGGGYAMSLDTCHEKISDDQDEIMSPPAHIPSPKSAHTASLSGSPHRIPTITTSNPVFDDGGHTTTPGVTIQSRSTNKSKSQTHLSKKRPVEDPDDGGKYKVKRAKHVRPQGINPRREYIKQKLHGKIAAAHVSKGTRPHGHSVRLRPMKESIEALKKFSARTHGPQVPLLAQRVAENEDNGEWRGNRHNDGVVDNSPSRDEIEAESESDKAESSGDEEGPRGMGESPDKGVDSRDEEVQSMGKGAPTLELSPQPHPISAIDSSYGEEESDQDDLSMHSMKLVEDSDLKDLNPTLPHRTPSLASQALALRSEIARKKSVTQAQQGKGKPNSGTQQPPRREEPKQDTQKATGKRKKAPAQQHTDKGKEKESKDLGLDSQGGEHEESKPLMNQEEATAVSGEVGSGANAETAAKGLPSRKGWDELPAPEKAATMSSGRDAISAFLSLKTPIPIEIRSYIRTVEEFCPEAASTSRALALHCLTSCFGNIVCIYHFSNDKSGRVNDTKPQRNHQVTGVPWARRMNPRVRARDTPLVKLESKATNCGCHQDDVLWDFYWWKNARLYSPTLDITEDWGSTRIEPRIRGFIVTFLQNFTHTRVREIYSGTTDRNRTRLHLLRKMEENIISARLELEEEMQRCAIEPPTSDSESD